MEKEYYQAHLVRRMVAGLIDYGIICTLYLIFDSLGAIYLILAFLSWALLTVGTEQKFGSTLGNRIVGLKPLSVVDFQKPTFLQSLKRHLLDPIDLFALGFATILIISFSKKKQRLGDMWAKTIVVKAQENLSHATTI